MGRLGEVALLLALFVLLGSMSGTRAQYDEYDYEDYDEADYDEDEDVEEDYQEREADTSATPEETGEGGISPTAGAQNQEFAPMCNNENCWIRVDWEPPPRHTWMSCLLGYRVGFRKLGLGLGQRDWVWMNDEGTHIDLRSDKLFFFEEAEGTNHSLTIPNLDFETEYGIIIEVFNPHGNGLFRVHEVDTPPGSCIKVTLHVLF